MTRPSTRLGNGRGDAGERGCVLSGAEELAAVGEKGGAGGFEAGGAVAEAGAAAGFEVGEGEGGGVVQCGVEGFRAGGAGEVLAQDERGGDDEDEALGEPEDGEDFPEEAAHSGSASGEGAAKDELVAGAADGLDAVFDGGIGGEFAAEAADVHVE